MFAAAVSCVTITTARPSSAPARSSRSTSAPACTSRLPVGSSASSTAGSLTSARAIAKRCCSPPQSWCGSEPATGRSPSRSISARPRAAASGDAPRTRPASSTLASPESSGSRWKNWKTNPIRCRRSRDSARSPAPVTRSPATEIVPASGRSSPPIRCSKRRLAGPGAAEDRDHLAGGDVQRRAVQHPPRGPAFTVGLHDALGGDDSGHPTHRRPALKPRSGRRRSLGQRRFTLSSWLTECALTRSDPGAWRGPAGAGLATSSADPPATGDRLRDHLARETPICARIARFMDTGRLVPARPDHGAPARRAARAGLPARRLHARDRGAGRGAGAARARSPWPSLLDVPDDTVVARARRPRALTTIATDVVRVRLRVYARADRAAARPTTTPSGCCAGWTAHAEPEVAVARRGPRRARGHGLTKRRRRPRRGAAGLGPYFARRVELHRAGVHAVAQPAAVARAVLEHVPEVAAAALADDLGADHPVRDVALDLDGLGHLRLGEARPARARLELRVGVEQLRAAAGTAVDAVLVVVPVLPGERPLGARPYAAPGTARASAPRATARQSSRQSPCPYSPGYPRIVTRGLRVRRRRGRRRAKKRRSARGRRGRGATRRRQRRSCARSSAIIVMRVGCIAPSSGWKLRLEHPRAEHAPLHRAVGADLTRRTPYARDASPLGPRSRRAPG